MAEQNLYDQASRRAVAALAGGGQPQATDLTLIGEHLSDRIKSKFRALPEEDRHDVVSDAIEQLIRAARQGRIDPSRNPGGYIYMVAHNHAVDLLGRRRE